MTNLGFQLAMGARASTWSITEVGDRYVVAEMLKGDYVLGGEQSGHIINRDGHHGRRPGHRALLLQASRETGLPLPRRPR